MHFGGEIDSRGTYTVLAVARMLNILTPQLALGAAEFLLACQTYEGGFGGEPGNEVSAQFVCMCVFSAALSLTLALTAAPPPPCTSRHTAGTISAR